MPGNDHGWDDPEHRFVIDLAIDATTPPKGALEMAQRWEAVAEMEGLSLGQWIAFTEFLAWRARKTYLQMAKSNPESATQLETRIALHEANRA